MRLQWTKWATWLYYPDEGKELCLRHLKGRTWRGTEGEAGNIAMWRQRHDEKRPQVTEESSIEVEIYGDEPECVLGDEDVEA